MWLVIVKALWILGDPPRLFRFGSSRYRFPPFAVKGVFEMQYSRSIVCLLALAGAVACGSNTQRIRMSSSPEIPAAQGSLEATGTPNDNTALAVDVRHLAPPERVVPGATTYVVWVRNTAQGEAQNVGALQVDGDLNGRLKTTTPFRSFQLFITAEAVPTATIPRGQELFQATVPRERD